MSQTGFGLAPPNVYGAPAYTGIQTNDAFPSLQASGSDMSQMAPPAINIDFAPNGSEPTAGGRQIDQDSLTPPDRGMCRKFSQCLDCILIISVLQVVRDLALAQSRTHFTLVAAC